MTVAAFIQARMSSRRFPGKVLAPFAGQPVIDHVLARVADALPRDRIVVATSTDPSDDPLAAHLLARGVAVWRGPLDDVVGRLQQCLTATPCDWFFRVCADSPLLDSTLFARLQEQARDGVDIVTNVYPRSFPKGQSLELLNAASFLRLDPARLSAEEREHVTKVFYDQPARFCIVNVSATGADRSRQSVAVDTPEDLAALEHSR